MGPPMGAHDFGLFQRLRAYSRGGRRAPGRQCRARRPGRRQITPGPSILVAYDVMELNGQDMRPERLWKSAGNG